MEGDGGDVPSARRAGGAGTEAPPEDDVLLLADEKFDFDLSLSSLSANEDDEVFFGPVGHKERCVAASLDLGSQRPGGPPLPASESRCHWSPLTGEAFVEVYKEARLLALQLEGRGRDRAAPVAGPAGPGGRGVERFIQESKLKVKLFEKESHTEKSPASLKRETYYLADSPLGPQLSGIQPPLGVGPPSAPAQAGFAPWERPPPPSRASVPVEPSPVHLPNQPVAQKGVVSKLLPPRASSAFGGKSTRLATEKPVKEKPGSPPRTKILDEKESHGDMPPAKPSAARDVTGLPAQGSHSVRGKRPLPVPSKLGLTRTLLKPPGRAGGPARRSSSSGRGAGACACPAAHRAKSGERPGVAAAGSRPPSHHSQAGEAVVCRQGRCPGPAELAAPSTLALVDPGAAERGGPRPSSQPSLPGPPRRSRPGSTGREPSLTAGTQATPAAAGQFRIPRFPAGGPLDRVAPPLPRAQRPQSCTPAGRVLFVCDLGGTGWDWTPDASAPSMSHTEVPPLAASGDSQPRTPLRLGPRREQLHGLCRPESPVETPAASAALAGCSATSCVEAVSAETPVPRQGSPRHSRAALLGAGPADPCQHETHVRLAHACPPSALQPATGDPSNHAQGAGVSAVRGGAATLLGAPAKVCSEHHPCEPGQQPGGPPGPVRVSRQELSPAGALSFSLRGRLTALFRKVSPQTPASDEARPRDEAAPGEAVLGDVPLAQLRISPGAGGTPLVDRPLIDFCSPPEAPAAPGPGGGPLADLLVNTPDMDRLPPPPKPLHGGGQLIDLCSPLIQLSPEADKENAGSPLLKL